MWQLQEDLVIRGYFIYTRVTVIQLRKNKAVTKRKSHQDASLKTRRSWYSGINWLLGDQVVLGL